MGLKLVAVHLSEIKSKGVLCDNHLRRLALKKTWMPHPCGLVFIGLQEYKLSVGSLHKAQTVHFFAKRRTDIPCTRSLTVDPTAERQKRRENSTTQFDHSLITLPSRVRLCFRGVRVAWKHSTMLPQTWRKSCKKLLNQLDSEREA